METKCIHVCAGREGRRRVGGREGWREGGREEDGGGRGKEGGWAHILLLCASRTALVVFL